MIETIEVEKASLTNHVIINIKSFLIENVFVLYFLFSLFAKGLIFEFLLKVMPTFPAVLRPLLISFFVTSLLFAPIFLLKKVKFNFAFGLNLFFSVVIVVDMVYIRYFNTFPSVSLFSILGQTGEALPSAIGSLVRLSDFVFLLDLLLIAVFKKKIEEKTSKLKMFEYDKRLKFLPLILSLLLLLVIVPIERNGFWKEANKSIVSGMVVLEKYGFIGAHFFDIYQNIKPVTLVLSEGGKGDILSKVSELTTKPSANSFTGTAKGKNVIFLQVESLQSFFLKKTIEGQEITPNINKLMSESHNFDNNYFELGAGGTSDIDFVSNTSLFPLTAESAFVKYGKDDFTSVAKELKTEGYSTYAYHANGRGFWNRNVAFNSLGFEKYFASDNYPKGEKVGMGIDDKEFLAKTAEYIKDQPKPAFSYAITLTNHYPFDLPESERLLKLKENYPSMSTKYLQTVRFTDEAIGQFISQLKKDGLYDNSVIVLYGDHAAKIDDFSFDGNNYQFKDINNRKVPLIIKLPNQKKAVSHTGVSSTIDIMPTILNLVGKVSKVPMFGRDLFGKTEAFYSAVWYFENGFMENEKNIYIPSKEANFADGSCYNLKWQKIDIESCRVLFNKSEENKKYSSLLLKANLFNQLK